MTWTLHIVGHENEDRLQQVMGALVTALEGIGHHLDSATLSTDTNSVQLSLAQPEPVPDTPPVQTPLADSAPTPESTTPEATTEDEPASDVAVDTPPTL